MASRVNTKFVIILGVVLLALVGVAAFVGAKAMSKSSDDLVRLGDEAGKAGDWAKAASFYGRAVNKDQRNAQWIKRWIDAMEHQTPSSRQAYQDLYFSQYLTALRALCDADRLEPANFVNYLNERYQVTQLEGRLVSWEAFAKHVDEMAKTYTGNEQGRKRILRFRGLAVAGTLGVNADAKEETITPAIKDLTDALEAQPDDWRAAIGASDLEVALAEIERKRGNTDAMNQHLAAAKGILNKFEADHPPAPIAKFRLLVLDLADAARAYRESTQISKDPFPGPALLKARDNRMKEIVDGLRAQKPEELDPQFTVNIAVAAIEAFPGEGEQIARELVAKAQQGNPKEAAILYIGEGVIAGQRNRNDESEAAFRKAIDLPDMPLSLQGVRLITGDRLRALSLLSELYYGQWRDAANTPDPSRQADASKRMAELAAKFEKTRNEMVARVGESDQNVMAMDARLLLMKGDISGARVKVTQYNEQTDRRNVSMLLLEADIMRRTANYGGAKLVYTRIYELEPRNLEALLGLADIETKQTNLTEAVRWLTLAAAIAPNNDGIQKLLVDTRAMASGAADDPVMRAIGEAQRMSEGITRDFPGAIEHIKKALVDRPNDPKLCAALAQLQLVTNDREAARKTVADALKANPTNDLLKRFEKAVARDNQLEAMLEVIDSNPQASPLQKELARFELFMKGNEPEKARQHLAAAEKIDPDAPLLVEMLFTDAIARGDKAKISELSDKAERLNLDGLNGATYRARREITEQRYDDAVKTLREAVAKDRFNVLSWRLLGMLQFQRGQWKDASDALSKAVEINNTDVPSLKALMRAYWQQARFAEALSIGRRSEKAAAGDADYAELMLLLEAEAPGGDRARATEARRTLAQRQPDNKNNKVRLAQLLINDKKFPEAKAIVDELRAKDKLDAEGVELEAGLAAAQGRLGDALQIYQDYINALPEDKVTVTPFINGAMMVGSFGQIEAAAAMLEAGRKYQDAKARPIDRQLGDLYYSAAQYPKAVEWYSKVLEGGTEDPEHRVRKRIIEANLRSQNYPDVDKMIDSLGSDGQKDLTLLLLAAESKAAQNKRDTARTIYDDAVRQFPKNITVFLKRGDFYLTDPATVREARQDYEQILRIDPNSVVARVRLANLLRATGDVDGALENFKKAVDADPGDDRLRLNYIDMLMQRGKQAEAVASVDQIVQLQPNNPAWLVRGAELMVRLGRHDRAAGYLSSVWKLKPSPEVAVFYLSALLSKEPPDLVTAQEVLVNPASKTEMVIPLRLGKARWFRLQNKMKEASDEVLATMSLVDPNRPDDTLQFVGGLEGVYPKPAERINALAAIEQNTPFKEWMKLHAWLVRMQDEKLREQGVRAIREIAETTQNTGLRARAWSLVGGQLYDAGKWDEALEAFRKGLADDPKSPELNNNIAFTLATKLNRPDEALPFAQSAVDNAPNNSGFLDTLAAVYIGKRDWAKASNYLAQATSVASSDTERAPAFLHMARVQLEMGNRSEARRFYRQAEEIIRNSPGLTRTYETDLKELLKAIDGV